MPALRLSYLNLPVKLRQCFALCAIFPKDERVNKQFLIELWMANGFVSSNEMLEAEDVGNLVWNELHWRSFFQDIETDKFGKITSFKMHDLVHDLAQSVTEETCCITNDNDIPSTYKKIRHLSIDMELFGAVHSIRLPDTKSLKTHITPDQYTTVQLTNILKCHFLRVLDFQRTQNLSSSIGHLKYLRYLNLSWGDFRALPESLCRLWNLQILKLDNCWALKKLPKSLIHLKALQHIYLNNCESLLSLPPHIRKLTSLKTLSMYVVGKKRGCLMEELGQLNLKGELHIKHLERVKSVTDAKEANMSSKHLNHLWLSWGRNKESQLQENVEQILEMLQPRTQQLQNLGVGGYRGSCFPQWMSGLSLKYLKRLLLVDCKSCSYLNKESYDAGRTAGGFIALEYLLLEGMENMISLSKEDGENMFPCLSKLEIIKCPNLLCLPCLPSLKDLYILGECSQELLSSIHKSRSLENMWLEHNEELTCFPDGMLSNLTSLKKLVIRGHSKLEVLPTEITNLSALRVLHISDCESLKSLTNEVLQGLHSLVILELVRCPKFILSAGFRYLTCLEELAIGNFSEVEEGLHEALQHMTSLQSLSLSELPNLTSLPDCFGNLGSLHSLQISACPNLTCLPTTIQCLNALKVLNICGCPELATRCQKETGEDWTKIAHVKYLHISNDDKLYCYALAGIRDVLHEDRFRP